MGSNRAALNSLVDTAERGGRGQSSRRKTPAAVAEATPGLRVLLDDEGKPATLRDFVAAQLHAAFVTRNPHWPDGPHPDAMHDARAAWREVDHYFEARKEFLAQHH